MDPGGIGRQLYRLLACARRAQSSTGRKQHAYAPGSAEELNLRYNTHYIAPNAATVLVGVLSLLLGAMVTFIVVLAAAVCAGARLGLAAALAGSTGPVRAARGVGRGHRAGLVAAAGDRGRDHARAVRVLVADPGPGGQARPAAGRGCWGRSGRMAPTAGPTARHGWAGPPP